MRFSRRQQIAAAVVAVAALLAAGFVLLRGPGKTHLTVYFQQAPGLYAGDRVLVLGVPVGQIDSIAAEPGRVRVELSYDSKVKIPAGADAAIVAPTLVTSRSVQLSPAYTRGPALADGATIPESRTAVPVEWDQVEQELNRLATALGPHTPGTAGALTRLVNTASANLHGQGQNLHDTLAQLSAAAGTLSASRGNLFATVANLQLFISVLAKANAQVGTFDQQLASVSGVLASNKQELATTLATLDSSLSVVQKFVHDNRGQLAVSLASLDKVTANLARSGQNIADILQVAPTELSNFNNIYDPVDTSLTGTLALANFKSPAQFICSTVFSFGGTPAQCQEALKPLAQLLQMDTVPVSVDPVNRNGRSNQVSSSGAGSGGSSGPGGGLVGLLLGGGNS